MDGQVADHSIGLERDERFALWLASTAQGQEHSADGVFTMRRTSRSSAHRYPWWDYRGSIQAVQPRRKIADCAVGFGSVQSGLQGCGIIGVAVAFRTVLASIDLTGCGAGGLRSVNLCCTECPQRAEGQCRISNKVPARKAGGF